MTKQAVFAMCLAGGNVAVDFDPRVAGVVLPPGALSEDHPHICTLEYGLAMALPMLDLDADEVGIQATLSFKRVPSVTFIPWSAVFGISPASQDSRTVWWADMPPEVGAFVSPKRPRSSAGVC